MPLLLSSVSCSGRMIVRIRIPSHLISNAHPSSSTGSVPVTAFIGRSCSSFTDYNTRMGDSLAGQAGLVTGGGSGIGLACARHLVRDGASVTLMGRSEDRLRSATDALAADVAAGAKVQWVAGDTSSEDDIAAAVESASAMTGALQLVVASAGTGTMGPVVATSMSEWERVLDRQPHRARSSRSSTPLRSSRAPAEARSLPSLRSPARSPIRTWRRTRCRRRASRRSSATRPTSSGAPVCG